MKQGSELSTSDFVEIATLDSKPKYLMAYSILTGYSNSLQVYYWDIEADELHSVYKSSSGASDTIITNNLFIVDGNILKYKCENQYMLSTTRFVIAT